MATALHMGGADAVWMSTAAKQLVEAPGSVFLTEEERGAPTKTVQRRHGDIPGFASLMGEEGLASSSPARKPPEIIQAFALHMGAGSGVNPKTVPKRLWEIPSFVKCTEEVPLAPWIIAMMFL
mmetsp:Transcript_31084/g.43074  ORF Transcript_31084/g.43074 Transcript_31084/m.43074 type:complete len:123 (-) Transcript_31084:1299-1667(-)